MRSNSWEDMMTLQAFDLKVSMFQVQHVPILKPEICSLDGLRIFLYITQFYLSNNMLVCPFQRILDSSPHVHLLMRIIETKNVPYMPHVRIQIWIKIIFFDNPCASYSDKHYVVCTGQNVNWAQVHWDQFSSFLGSRHRVCTHSELCHSKQWVIL